jgi:sporulation protein YlmC with PRC-barrel domain
MSRAGTHVRRWTVPVQTMALELRVLGGRSLIDAKVINLIGEELGKIENLMIELGSGCIAYAVLSCQGFLGPDERLFPIPWRVLAVDTAEKQFILDVDREFLLQAPSFTRSNWPDMADRVWGTTVFAYYGCEPYWD